MANDPFLTKLSIEGLAERVALCPAPQILTATYSPLEFTPESLNFLKSIIKSDFFIDQPFLFRLYDNGIQVGVALLFFMKHLNEEFDTSLAIAGQVTGFVSGILSASAPDFELFIIE